MRGKAFRSSRTRLGKKQIGIKLNVICKVKIKPFIGIDNLRLGSTKKQTFDYLGKYDERIYWAFSINLKSEIWKYNELGIELAFDYMDGYHLSRIFSYSKKAEFEGIKPIGKSEQELLAFFPSVRTSNNPEDCMKFYRLDKWELTFSVFERRVSGVTIFSLYDENKENWLWPIKLNTKVLK